MITFVPCANNEKFESFDRLVVHWSAKIWVVLMFPWSLSLGPIDNGRQTQRRRADIMECLSASHNTFPYSLAQVLQKGPQDTKMNKYRNIYISTPCSFFTITILYINMRLHDNIKWQSFLWSRFVSILSEWTKTLFNFSFFSATSNCSILLIDFKTRF